MYVISEIIDVLIRALDGLVKGLPVNSDFGW